MILTQRYSVSATLSLGSSGSLTFQPAPDALQILLAPFYRGSTGSSAYEVAVDQGFAGTENEWLASLVGPQGTVIHISSTPPANPTLNDLWVDIS